MPRLKEIDMDKRRFGYGMYIVIALAILLTLFYDTFQPRSIETVAVISGMGIEKGQDKALKFTVQIIKPGAGSSSDGNDASSVTISANGDTVSEACEDLVAKTGSVLFWSHCAVVIIKKDLAKTDDMVKHLDLFFRSSNFRNTSAVIFSDESPQDVLEATTLSETVSAFGIRKLMDDQEYESNSVYTTVKRFVKDYYSQSGCGVVTGVELVELGNSGSDTDESRTERSVSLGNVSIVKDGKYVDVLNDEEFNGYKWLTDTMRARTVTLTDVTLESENNEKNDLGFTLFRGNTRIKPIYDNGKYILKVTVSATAELIYVKNELQSKNISTYKLNKRYEEMGKLVAQNIQYEMRQALDKMALKDCDFCGIDDIFYSYLGKQWNGDKYENIEQMLDDIEFEMEYDITVTSGGLNKRYKLKNLK